MRIRRLGFCSLSVGHVVIIVVCGVPGSGVGIDRGDASSDLGFIADLSGLLPASIGPCWPLDYTQ